MKFIKLKLTNNIISIDNVNFASLVKYQKNFSFYEFFYTIDTAEALKKNATAVKIFITPTELPKPQSIFTLNTLNFKPSPALLVDNILKINAIKKDTKNNNLNSIIKTKISDFTIKVANDNLFAPVQKTVFKILPIQAIKQQNQAEPILQKTIFEALPIVQTVKALSLKSILQDKKDPGDIVTNFTTPSTKGFEGLSLTKQLLPLKAADKLVFKVLDGFNVENTDDEGLEISTVIPIVSKGADNKQFISKIISFDPNFLNGFGEFQVHFELMGQNDLVLQKISKKVDHAKNIKVIQTPSISPIVNVINLNKPGKNILEITQKDNNAVAVSIFRKEIKKTMRVEDAKYTFVSKVDVEKESGTIVFEDLVGNASDIIYRIIPVGEVDQLGSVYTNVVAPAVRTKLVSKINNRLIYSGVIAQINQQGVEISVFSLPPGVAAIKVLARDNTIFEKNFRVILSEASKSSTLSVSDIDTTYIFLDDLNLKTGHIYEYCCVLLFENGDEEISTGCDFIEYIPFSIGVVDTQISLPRTLTTNKGLDVQFRISSKIIDNDLSSVKALLESQGLAELYGDEIANEKTSLNDLIAHSIRRVDLTTGKSEHFKTFSGNVFSDAANRDVNFVSPLVAGRTYRYIVSALLRSPETLFENNVKTIENKIGLEVEVLPLKFLHPIALNLGSIVTPASLKANHSKDPFEFGDIGNFISQDVAIDITRPKIFDAKVIRFNDQINILRWSVLGEKALIDHFLIIVERFGSEDIIGKAHTKFPSKIIQFLDKETSKEPGTFRYKVIPVFKTYEHGPALFSDEVVV